MACTITYKDKEYTHAEFAAKLHDGLLDELIKDKTIDKTELSKVVSKYDINLTNKKKEPRNPIEENVENDFIQKTRKSLQSEEVGKSPEQIIGLTKKEVQKLRNELGEEQYQHEIRKTSEVAKKAQKMIDEGYNVRGLVEKVKEGEIPKSDIEVQILRRYYGSLTDAINKNPTPELLKERQEFLSATDIAKTETGRVVQSWNGFTAIKDDLADFLAEEAKYSDLSENEIIELTDKYKKAEEAKNKLQARVDELTAKLKDKKALEQIAKIKRERVRNIDREKVKQAEQDYRKLRIDAFRQELRKIRNETNAIIFPYQRELIAAIPVVKDLALSYAREGINDLKIILRGIKEELANDISDITEEDVRDILAGQYSDPKKTKNAKLSLIRDIQRQAKLELEIENLQKGIAKEKSPSQRKKKSDAILDLERQLKIVQQQNPDLIYPEKLEERKNWYKNKIEKIKDEIKRGEYDPIVEPIKIVLDKEALQLKDEYIKFKEETRERREKKEDETKTKTEKALNTLQQISELPRLVQTAIDVSIPFRQGIRIMFNPRTSAIGGRAYYEMIKSIFNIDAKWLRKVQFSEKNYQRLMYDIEHNIKFLEAKDDGIIFTQYGSSDNILRDENHRKNFVYNIPYLSAPLRASERAAAAWTNYARFELYLKGVKALENQGKTRINNKKAYEQMAARIMTDTGRGKIPLLPEISRSEGESKVKKILGTIMYGPRLVSSIIRRLNPLYYFNPKVDKTVRMEAAKDLLGYVSAQVILGIAASQLGYTISLDPDDSDFLRLRKGKDVIDVTGGESTAVRTAFRLIKAVLLRADPTVNKEDADKYSAFAEQSFSTFWRNKLSPTYGYMVDFFTGKNSIGEDFNPYEILKIYPMYTDDIISAIKEDEVSSLLYILPIGLSGFGYMKYEKDIRKANINNYLTDKDNELKNFLNKNQLNIKGNINQESYDNKTGTMQPMTKQESDDFERHWSELVINKLKERINDINEIKKSKFSDERKEKKIKQIISIIKAQATINTQRYISGIAKKDLSFKLDDKDYELTSSEAQQMFKYIKEFNSSNEYKKLIEDLKSQNKYLKSINEKPIDIENELQEEAISYAKEKIINENIDKNGEIKLAEKID